MEHLETECGAPVESGHTAAASVRADSARRLWKLAVHEAAHAAISWDLGFGVRRIIVNRLTDSGHSQPIRGMKKDRLSRLAYSIMCVAGLAAQAPIEGELKREDAARSMPDFQMALAAFLPPGDLTDGEELGVALALTRRTIALVERPEVWAQVTALAQPLTICGCLLERKVDSILSRLPASHAAKTHCREFITAIEADRDAIIESARGYAPQFSWTFAAEVTAAQRG